ncbi:uncharacterized protein RJT20DRAFT_116427 [Scheffersomyces xylosifermentans]|uniref:uncharacterized protein n=1 Tax=Scheffersomyces xylosifermentans TaxID=1304137 RepID=UPI00315C9BCE
MHIEDSINDVYIRTLNLGCFPKNVLEFQESQDFFQQLIFIDYQLQLLVQNEFNRNEFMTAKVLELQGKTSSRDKLTQLINYVHSITLNYNNSTNSYDEKLYYSILMAHLYYLNSQVDEMAQIMKSVHVPVKFIPSESQSKYQNDFIHYLSCRYHVLMGFTNVKNAYYIWIDYLLQSSVPFKKSEVGGQYWLGLLFSRLTNRLTDNGVTPLSFQGVKNQKFFDNKLSTIRFCTFLLRPDSSRLVNSSFKSEFATYLASELEGRLGSKTKFPDAASSNDELTDYVDNLYQSLSYVPFNRSVLKPSSSKKFLINSTTKSFQSETVVANFVSTLIDLKEYDEALAAFKTYIAYVEKNEEQTGGIIEDLLLTIDVYANSIISFNPLNSIVNKSNERFKYTKEDTVITSLARFCDQLLEYLNKLSTFVNLTYDDEGEEVNPLSFLYLRYNVNVLQSDKSQFVQVVSRAWYALGYYYYYLSIYQSSSEIVLHENVSNVIKYYKNALIINSTGSEQFLFSYALALAHSKHLKEALRLTKFILKKYPESFKTWNLLVLLLSSFQTNDPDSDLPPVPQRLPGTPSSEEDRPSDEEAAVANGFRKNGASIHIKERPLSEPEKFVNNALNIAGLYIQKFRQKDIKLSTEVKYEILQLKMTQIAVYESIHGVSYTLEYLSEVFVLYHELFDAPFDSLDNAIKNGHASNGRSTISNKWSHRPSVIDPSPSAAAKPENGASNIKEKLLSVDRIKRLSKLNAPISSKRNTVVSGSSTSSDTERRILQDLWLWTARIYLKIGLLEDCEQCIVEAESAYEPNIKTYTTLGYLTSKTRKFLALQEFERSLEIVNKDDPYNRIDYGYTLLGLSKLFIIDDVKDNSLFISGKDVNAGLIRLKNLLEKYSLSWPYGHNNSELWFYLSKIYENVDDKTLLTKSLWKCVELEDFRPVRSFNVCEDYNF